MSDKSDIQSSIDDHQDGRLDQARNLFLDLFGRRTKSLNQKKSTTHQEEEPNFEDVERTISNLSSHDDLGKSGLEVKLSRSTVQERLRNLDRKTFLFAGYIFWAMLFVSGGAAAVTLIARKPRDDPTIAPIITPTEAPTITPTIAPTIAPTTAPTNFPTIRNDLQELHLSVMNTLKDHFIDNYGGECTSSIMGQLNCARPNTRRLGYGNNNRGLCSVTYEYFRPISAEYRWDPSTSRPIAVSVTKRNAPGNMCEYTGSRTEVIYLDYACDEDCFKDRLGNAFTSPWSWR